MVDRLEILPGGPMLRRIGSRTGARRSVRLGLRARWRLGTAALRDARWLTVDRLRAYVTLLCIGFVTVLAGMVSGYGGLAGDRPVGADFASFWTVSWALHHGRLAAIYAPAALAGLERQMFGAAAGFYAWQYPPPALFLVYPLALLPYAGALAAWLALGLGFYLSALWRIRPRLLTLAAGVAFPAVLVTVIHGQNAFVTAGLLGWGLLLLPRRPILAGALFGLLTFKPQLGLLLPVALVAGGEWRAVAAATISAVLLAAGSSACFGAGAWAGFLAGTTLSRQILTLGLVSYFKMQSAFAAIRLLGGSVVLAFVGQALVAASAAAIVAWAWRRPIGVGLRNAILLAAIPLATPFVFDYDLLLLAPAIAWLAGELRRTGPLPWEKTALTAVALAPLFSRPVADGTHLLLAPLATAALLATLVARVRAEALGRESRQREPAAGFA